MCRVRISPPFVFSRTDLIFALVNSDFSTGEYGSKKTFVKSNCFFSIKSSSQIIPEDYFFQFLNYERIFNLASTQYSITLTEKLPKYYKVNSYFISPRKQLTSKKEFITKMISIISDLHFYMLHFKLTNAFLSQGNQD